MASRRQQILEAFLTLVQVIRTANGFATDAGLTVFLGETPTLGPDDPDTAIAIVVGEEAPTYQGENVFIALPVGIQALAKPDLDQPWLAAEAVLGDIKKAVELADRTLGGLVRRHIQRDVTRTMERRTG